jgi:hypothetical protein
MLAQAPGNAGRRLGKPRLLVLVLYGHFFEVFGLEDLAAIETFDVVYALPAG